MPAKKDKPVEPEYAILEQYTDEDYLNSARKSMEIIHAAETLWGKNPELGLNQVAHSVADVLSLPDLVLLATAFLEHFVRGAEDIS